MRSPVLALSFALVLAACGGAQQPSSARGSGPGTAPGNTSEAPGETAGAGPSAAGEGTVISFRTPAVGSERTEKQDFALSMKVSEVDGGKVKRSEQVEETRSSVQHTTVLATQDSAITKKKVRYDKLEVTRVNGEHSMSDPSPLTGKTYVLSLEAGKLKAVREGGEPVSDMELERLADDNKSFGKPPRFAAFVPEHPLKPGDTFKPDRDALFEMFGPGDKDFGDVEFRFEGEESVAGKRAARFTFVATIAEKSGVTMRSKGHVLLLVDSGWPLELVMNADVSLDAPGRAPGQKVTGRGKAQMVLGAEYH